MDKGTYENPYKLYVDIGGEKLWAEYLQDTSNLGHIFSSYLNKLNSLEKLWNLLTTSFYKVKYTFSKCYWKIRYGFERFFKGYDSVDCFETFSKFIERYSKILRRLRDNHHGYPVEFNSSEEWSAVLDKMLKHLHFMDEGTVESELCKGAPTNWTPHPRTVAKVMEIHKEKFFSLFSKYFYNLWD